MDDLNPLIASGKKGDFAKFRTANMEWIDANEELPDDEETVLIALDDGEVWTGYHSEGRWWYVCADPIDSARITHWLPFPPAPEAV
jgi:hypothetical protein